MVLDLGEQPLANALLVDSDEKAGTAPLVLVRCRDCSGMQLSVTVNPETMFRDYLWVTGTSASSVAHCHWLAGQIIERCHQAEPRVLEMASNDGTLLKELQKRGASVLGVDPARNLAAEANLEGVETIPEFYNKAFASKIIAEREPFDIAIARNVLSHVPDPVSAVAALAMPIRQTGICVVEFHRADIILEELHYDSIYHEHTMYHTLRSMTEIVEKAGLVPFDILPSPISGGSWVLFAAPREAKRPPTVRWTQAWENEEGTRVWEIEAWEEFASQVGHHQDALVRELVGRAESGQVVVAYGASARSSTILNACRLTQCEIASIADSNRLKQGMYSPGTGIPIEAPEAALARNPDAILLLAFNFRSEIEDYLRRHHWQGDLISVFPAGLKVVEFK